MPSPIIVVGSLNMDFVARVDRLPIGGETVLGGAFQTIPGGKGANQACAGGRLGGKVRMIGRVGEDVFGGQLRDSLRNAGVEVGGVQSTPGAPTGVAIIVVDARGENQIVVAPGANALVTTDDVRDAFADDGDGFLLLQLETPIEAVAVAAAAAKSRGLTVILDPAPARTLPPALLRHVDVLTPNETEANILLGRRDAAVSVDDAPQAAAALRALGVDAVVLKLGARGAYVSSRSEEGHFPAPRVDVVDATAAGDTFNGALAVALSEGRALGDAIAFANVAAALSVTRAGAQSSIPSRSEVNATIRASS